MQTMLDPAKGFSIVDLLVTVAIIGISAMVAFPIYTGYIQTSRRAEGEHNLQTIRLAQTEFFSENNTYFSGANTAALIANSSGLWTPAKANETNREFTYSVTVPTGNPRTYTATATGKGNNVPVTVIITYP